MLEGNSITPLSHDEYELLSEAVCQLIKQYPFPENVGKIPIYANRWKEKECIAVFVYNERGIDGYTRHNVLGGYEARNRIDIAYKCFPSTDKQQFFSQKIVNDIAKWLKDVKNLPALTDGRVIQKIELLNSFPTKDEEGEDGNMVFVSSASLTYESN